MTFKVFVDDNYHFQDESERYELGEYESFEAAIAVCKLIVDEYLESAFKPGMSASVLYKNYISFGEDPFIVPNPEGKDFSAWAYAKQRCAEITDTIQAACFDENRTDNQHPFAEATFGPGFQAPVWCRGGLESTNFIGRKKYIQGVNFFTSLRLGCEWVRFGNV